MNNDKREGKGGREGLILSNVIPICCLGIARLFKMLSCPSVFYDFKIFLFISLDLERRDKDGHVVLWFAILSSKVSLEDDPDSNYAAKLVKRGSSADAVNPLTGTAALTILGLGFRFLDGNSKTSRQLVRWDRILCARK